MFLLNVLCQTMNDLNIAFFLLQQNWKEMNYKCSEWNNPIRVVTSAPVRLAVLFLLGKIPLKTAVF